MTNSIQQNVSTLIFNVNAGMPGTKLDSQLNEKIFLGENFFRNEILFRNLLDSLNSLSDELTKLDACLRENSWENKAN
jgi:hypothetical protein